MATQTDPPFTPLLADVLTAVSSHTAAVTNAVIDGLTERAIDAEATVAAIRYRVFQLLDRRYTPTPALIEEALYPSREERARFRKEEGR